MQLTRRDFLIMGAAAVGAAGYLSACGPFGKEGAPSAAETAVPSGTLPPVTEIPTFSPTPPLPTPDWLATTQAAIIDGVTATAETLTNLREAFGLNRPDAWPGAKIVPDKKDSYGQQNLNAATMAVSYIEMKGLLTAGMAQFSEVSTFTFLDNFVQADLGANGEPAAFSRPDFLTWYRADSDLSRTRTWILTNGGEFIEANSIETTLKDELEAIITGVFGARPTPAMVHQLYQELTKNLYVVKKGRNQWGGQEDQVSTVTRYMLPADTRANQQLVDVCTWYVSDLERGQDYFAINNVLIKPNSSQLMPLLAISKGGPAAFAQGVGYGTAQILDSNYWLTLAVLDPDSRPDHSLFKYSGVAKYGDDQTGPGCFTVLLGNCGGLGAPAGGQPGAEATPPVHRPTSIPTNPHHIPTKKPNNERPGNRQPTQIP